jgi:hypothetical protein
MFSAVHPTTDIAKILRHVRFVPIADITRCARASPSPQPKRVGRRSNWNKIGKHGHGYEPTPEPSTRGVVGIT